MERLRTSENAGQSFDGGANQIEFGLRGSEGHAGRLRVKTQHM